MEHLFEPVFDKNSKVLILGTFPSVKSRDAGFYYYHPQNRFWKVIAVLTKERFPETIDEKKEILLAHGIAVWDVIKSCDIQGSSDSSIKNVVPADLSVIIECADIKQIYANGGKAFELYQKYSKDKTGQEIVKLPSTSPANASCSLEKLLLEWNCITEYLM